MSRIPALILTQHNSGNVPFNILADMLGDEVHNAKRRETFLDYLYHEGDPYTDALFYCEDASHIHALTSRFVVDLNRRRDEGGLNGVIKVTDFSGRPLYREDFRFTEKRIEERLKRYYDPFHETVNRMLAKEDIDFFVDGHAMTSKGPNIGPDTGKPRPALCVMTGGDKQGEPLDTHTSLCASQARLVVDLLWQYFGDIIKDSDAPDSILLNDPFGAGGTIQRLSNPHWPSHKAGFGIEINKSLYMESCHGQDVPIEGRIALLNTRFQAFMAAFAQQFSFSPD